MIIALFAWLFVSSLITALLEAWSLQHLWAWFAAAELGPGPSMGTWYGIASIFSLALFMSQPLPACRLNPREVADSADIGATTTRAPDCETVLLRSARHKAIPQRWLDTFNSETVQDLLSRRITPP